MDDELLRRAKADPEAFRRETRHFLRELRACGASDIEAERQAVAHNDALLQALQEITPAERAALGR